MTQLLFYLRYAARNLRRNLRWTLFAIFSIGAGVAAIVALRTLGLAIGDSLIDTARVSNHGDITISTANFGSGFAGFVDDGGSGNGLSEGTLDRLRQRAADLGGQSTAYIIASNMQITTVDAVTVGRPQFVSALLVDPETFPVTDGLLIQEPAGASLRDLLGENEVVISRNLARDQGLNVGDTVRVSGTEAIFTVTGIVATEQEASLRNLFASFFGFAYLNIAQAEQLQISPQPNSISIVLPEGSDIDTIANEMGALAPRADVTNVNRLLRQNQQFSDIIGRFIVIMGLGALLIGGVGIINTMLVMVGRRTMEIASFKTFGLKGRQIGALFLAEAFFLGLFGSLIGCVMGILLSAVVNAYGETFLQQHLTWRIYPEAMLYGIALGMVVTMVFAILPVLTANRVRPAIILRPNEMSIPGTSIFHSLLVLLLVVIVIGGVAGRILGSAVAGMIGVALTLLFMGILVGILWLLVWLIGKLPAFGNVDLKLALRNLSSRRIRTATTLLALSGGMFALSSITFAGVGAREVMNFQLANQLGGNVLIFPFTSLVSAQVGRGLLNAQLNQIDGILYRTELQNYSATIVAVNGEPPNYVIPVPDFVLNSMPERARREMMEEMRDITVPMQARDTDNPNSLTGIVAGRGLTPDDADQAVIVVPEGDLTSQLGLTVGSTLTLREDGQLHDFKVVGVSAAPTVGFSTGAFYVPPNAFGAQPDFSFYVLQTEPDKLNEVLLALTANPLNFTIDISFIDGLLKRFIDQFSAIPTVVGLLSLLAAAVTMANTVSLATLERRRQIGILKTVGLKGNRVLGVMLLENTLIGLLGGVLGIGLSALGVAIATQLGVGEAIPIPREALPVAIALIVASIVIAWIATFLSARPAIAEQVTHVLRYE
ncbi:MAG: ABC transporter permease [Anaerolineae bacterium]|nr:ABC transporter permease [Anaerolineae bacterium]